MYVACSAWRAAFSLMFVVVSWSCVMCALFVWCTLCVLMWSSVFSALRSCSRFSLFCWPCLVLVVLAFVFVLFSSWEQTAGGHWLV